MTLPSYAMPTAQEALDRTILLMRDDLRAETPSHELMRALIDRTLLIVADEANLRCPEGQHALVTTFTLAARSGASVHVCAPNVPLLGPQPPLLGTHLLDAVCDLGEDLLPGIRCTVGVPRGQADLVAIIGDTRWPGLDDRTVRLNGDAWTGEMNRGRGERWQPTGSPFGALTAAGIAAAELFKLAMRTLARQATSPKRFTESFALTDSASIRLAPANTPPPGRTVGDFDVISGGAISHALLYTLARIPGVVGAARVFEPQQSELTNLNRYQLLRRSGVGRLKSADLSSLDYGALSVHGENKRFEISESGGSEVLRARVIVGVDDIPSRWAVQSVNPTWLGIGATSHYSAMASFHSRGLPCAWCLHPSYSATQGAIPTIAFVSHWAGLWLASRFIRYCGGEVLSPDQQVIYSSPLQPENPGALWISAAAHRRSCPMRCADREAGHLLLPPRSRR